MKTVLKSSKRFLAVLMALSMVVLSLPSSLLTAYADTVKRYSAVETVDGEGNPSVSYVEDENGEYVYDEATSSYVAYTEDPADPAATDPADPADPADPSNEGGNDSIQISNNALGAITSTKVSWTVDSGIDTVTVTQQPETGDAVEIANGGSYTVVNALNITVTFKDGYQLPETNTEDAPTLYYTVGGAAEKILLELEETEEGSGIYAHEDIFGEGPATGAIAITLTSEPITYEGKVQFVGAEEENDVTYSAYTIGGETAEITLGTGDAVYNAAMTFKAAPASPVATLTKMEYWVGSSDDLDEPTGTTTITANSSGVYTIPATAVAKMQELIAAEGDDEAAAKINIFVIPTLDAGTTVGIYPVFLTYDEEQGKWSYTGDALADANLAVDVNIEGEEPSDEKLAEIVAAYPLSVKTGSALSYTFRVANGYDKLRLKVLKYVEGEIEPVDITAKAEAKWDTSEEEYNKVTISVPETQTADTNSIIIAVKAVQELYNVNYDAATKDPNVSYTYASTVAEGGADFSFVLEPNEGYELDIEEGGHIAGLADAINAAATAKSAKNLIATGLYAVKKGVTPTAKMSLSQIYPVLPTIVTGANDNKSVVFVIDKALDGTTAISSDLTVYTGTVATGEVHNVTLEAEDDVVTNAEKFEEDGDYGNVAVFGTNYKFQLEIAENNKLTSVGVAIGEEDEVTLAPTTIDGETWYVIDGEDIVGDITITAHTVAVETAYAVINAASEELAGKVTAVSTAIGDGEKSYNGNVMPYETAAEDIKALPKIEGKSTATLKTGETLNIKVTLSDSSYRVSRLAINEANAETYLATSVTKSGNTYTIKGTVLAAGTSEDPTVITFAAVAQGGVKLTVTDNDSTKTVSGSLQAAVYTTEELAEMTSAEIDALPAAADFAAIKSPYALSGVDAGSFVFFRHKALANTSNYAVTPTGLTAMDEQPFEGYTTYQKVVTDGSIQAKTLTVSLDVADADTVYVYDKGEAGLTKLSLKADSADISNETKLEAYKTDYYTNKTSTKVGVVKLSDGANGYSMFPCVDSRTNKDKVDTKNLVFTFTLAGNYTPVIIIDNTAYGEVAGVTLKTTAGVLYSSSSVDKTKSQNLVLTVPKATTGLNGKTISFGATVADGQEITVFTGEGEDETTMNVTFSSGGKDLNVTKAAIVSEVFGYASTPKIGEKQTITVAPAEGFTIQKATLFTYNTVTEKESEKAITVKPETGFTLVLTGSAAETYNVEVTAVPSGDFEGLTYGSSTPAEGGIEKVAVDSKTKIQVTNWTYNALRPNVTYAFGAVFVGGATADVTAVTVTGATPDDTETSITKDGIKIGTKDIGKTFKLTVTAAGGDYSGVYEGVFTIKAAKSLTGLTVAGVTGNAQAGYALTSQEIGTVKDYLITASSGASLESLSVDSTVAALYTDAKTGKKYLRVSTTSETPADVAIRYAGATFMTIRVTPAASKVTGTTPSATLKSATDMDLSLNLALPSTVSSATYKNLATGMNLAYKLTLKNSEEGATPGTKTYYFPATGANQLESIAAVKDVIAEAAERGGAHDFTATLQLLLVKNTAEQIAADNYDPSTTTFASSDVLSGKTFSTKAVKYPTSVRVAAVNSKLYAGQAYADTGAKNTAMTAAEKKKSYVTIDSTEYFILANVTLDSAATVTDFAADAVSAPAGSLAKVTAIATAAKVLDGKLLVSSATMDTLLSTNDFAGTLSGTLVVNAPVKDENSTPVNATFAFTVEQRAFSYETGANVNVTASPATEKVVKKEGTALNLTLGMDYTTGAGTGAANAALSKAALNKWVYSRHAAGSTVTADDITISGNKITIKKDYVFPAAGTSVLKIDATSAYNSDVVVTTTINLSQAEAAEAQGELVLAQTLADEKTCLVAKKGEKVTNSVLKDAATGGTLKAILLKPNAVIEKDGVIANDYIVSDTNVAVTSSNTKVAEMGALTTPMYHEATNYTNAITFTYNAAGTVTFNGVAENTGAKKSVSINVVAGTLTKQDGFTITVDGIASSNTVDAKCNETAPTVTVNSTNNSFTIVVKKGTMNAAKTAWEIVPGALDDYYTSAALKAGTGTVIRSSEASASGYVDTYTVTMYGKTGKVSVGGKTYTITNTAKASAVSAGAVSHTAVYGNYGIAQEVTFTAAGSFAADQVNLTTDYAAATDILAVMNTKSILVTAAQTGIEVTKDAKGKNVFTVALATDSTTKYLTPGTYSFYATYLDDGGEIVTEPQKVSFKVSAAPAFSPKTSYTISLTNGEDAELAFTNSTGKVSAKVTGVYNMNSGGLDNAFRTLFEEDTDANGVLTLAANDTLLTVGALASNRTGYIEYTADGGITKKLAKVTLTFNADQTVTAAAIDAALTNAITSNWSVQNVTTAAAEKLVKSLVNVPSGVTVKVTSLDYEASDLASERDVALSMTVSVTKSGATKTVTKDMTIPVHDATLTLSTGADGIIYTVKDGANHTLTYGSTSSYVSESFKVLNGAILTVTAVKAADGYKPDTYAYALDDTVIKTAKSGAVAFGQIVGDADVEINALNAITLTRAANVNDITAKVEDTQIASTGSKNARATGYVTCGDTVTILATNAAGYEVAVKETVTKESLTTDAYTDVTAAANTEKTYAYAGEVEHVLADVNAARTYAATAVAHGFTIEIVDTNANDVFEENSLQIKNGNSWESAATLTAPFGQSVTFRLEKAKKIDATKAKSWTVTTSQTGILKDSTASGDYFTYTTEKTTLANRTITIVGQQNAGVTVTNGDLTGNKAISNLELWRVYVNGEEEPISAEKVSALTSGKQVVIPDPGPTDSETKLATYYVRYTVKDGYADWVAVGEADPAAPETSGIIKLGGTDDLKEGAILAYTITTKKDTHIGITDLETSVYDGEATANGIIASASYTYTVDGDEYEETITVTSDPEAADKIDPAINKKAITITAVTADGYDLQLLTFKPGSMAKPAAAAMTLKETAEDGTKTWTKTVTLGDAIAAIGFRPVAQTRTITLTNPYVAADVSSITYTTEKTPGVYGTAQKAASATATKVGSTSIKAPYKSTVKIDFTAVRGVEELELTGSESADLGGGIVGDYNATSKNSYAYTVKVNGGVGDTRTYTIVEASE